VSRENLTKDEDVTWKGSRDPGIDEYDPMTDINRRIDEYDPRNPELIMPASPNETNAKQKMVLTKQISCLQSTVERRRQSKQGSNDVVKHYERVLQDMVRENALAMGDDTLSDTADESRKSSKRKPLEEYDPQSNSFQRIRSL
jgi:hypothetical protein